MKSALIIINNSSGSKEKNLIKDALSKRLISENYKMTIKYTEESTGSAHIISTYASTSDLIVIVGGDGTISDVINHLSLNNMDVPIAVIPTGTANDFARSNNIPLDPIQAVESLNTEATKKIDIIEVNQRYASYLIAFGNFMSGFAKVPSSSKKKLGRLAYLSSGIKVVSALKKYRVQIKTDILDMEINSVFTLVSSISSVGSLEKLLPEAKADDGLLHIINIEPVKMIEVPKILYLALKGQITRHPKVTYLTANKVLIRSNSLTDMNIDGELHEYQDSQIKNLNRCFSLVKHN